MSWYSHKSHIGDGRQQMRSVFSRCCPACALCKYFPSRAWNVSSFSFLHFQTNSNLISTQHCSLGMRRGIPSWSSSTISIFHGMPACSERQSHPHVLDMIKAPSWRCRASRYSDSDSHSELDLETRRYDDLHSDNLDLQEYS